ncbi:MAG: AAA family ATPase [Bifidobacteriaceae bacterium]|nr:AAA family ATPase [Bifidobacteriaceae bacterium]
MTSLSSQIRDEQQAVDKAYNRLDDMRATVKQRLDATRAAGSHGSPTQRTERDSFATMYENRLTQLRAVEDRLVFGRLDTEAGTRRYIGRIGLSDNNHEPILTDWRAEAARPFYEATPSNHGDIIMRRHITLSFREVIGLEDEILDMNSDQVQNASQNGTLTGEGALLASLSSRRTGKMTDIVATIQAEQDRIIRAPLQRTVVVQGGPGTGKTAVALHRAAYLLYTNRNVLQRSGVLIIGPSNSFLRYIDQVLPSLGETGVVSRTIAELIPNITPTGTESAHAAQLKGDIRMYQAVANAIHARVRIPQQLPTIRINNFNISINSADIKQAQEEARRTRAPHNKARVTFINAMLQTLKLRYCEQLDYEPESAELNDVLLQLRMNDDVKKTLNLAWLPLNPQWLIDQLFAKPEQLRRFAPWLQEQEIKELVRPKGSPLTPSDIPLLDEAMERLGPDPKELAAIEAKKAQQAFEEEYAKEAIQQSGLGNGIINSRTLLDNINGLDDDLIANKAANDREWTYGHIVVDEAQELTAMQWRMLMRRCPSHSFTIVGDVAQTSALAGTRRWQNTMDKLFGEDSWDLYELSINYRNPKEVSEVASQFAQNEGLYISTQSAVRSVPNSVEQQVCDNHNQLLHTVAQDAIELANNYIERDGTGRIAVITPDSLIEETRDVIFTQLNEQNPELFNHLQQQNILDTQLRVYGAQEVKGLEYDGVIVVQPALIEQEAASRLVAASDLYVAMTRPTQKLFIVRTQQDVAERNF